MAKIENAKGREEGGGYERVFEGNKQLGHLMSRVHAASISSGIKLVSILKNQLKFIDDLDEFLTWDMREEGALMPEEIFIADRKMMQKCQTLDFAGLYPDFIIFKRIGGKQECHLVEMKDGDAFGTQKASAARQDSTFSWAETDRICRLRILSRISVASIKTTSKPFFRASKRAFIQMMP